jgi:acyl dehydratase
MLVIDGVDDLIAHAGAELGVSDWHAVTQPDVNTFADLTDDHQWIHVEVDRASSSSFGGTIAHGFLTLALIPGTAGQPDRHPGHHARTQLRAGPGPVPGPKCRWAVPSGCGCGLVRSPR